MGFFFSAWISEGHMVLLCTEYNAAFSYIFVISGYIHTPFNTFVLLACFRPLAAVYIESTSTYVVWLSGDAEVSTLP